MNGAELAKERCLKRESQTGNRIISTFRRIFYTVEKILLLPMQWKLTGVF